jgi:hypothetical protein
MMGLVRRLAGQNPSIYLRPPELPKRADLVSRQLLSFYPLVYRVSFDAEMNRNLFD